MNIPMLNLNRLHAPIKEELERAFAQVLSSGRFISGPRVEQFEQELGVAMDVPHVIGVSSGTDALLLSLMALGVKPGDEIITTPYTFFATVGAIVRLGAKPVFVDIRSDTYNLDVAKIEDCITPKTVGIIPVHLFGGMAQMDSLLEIGRENELWILEDAAQAIGATYNSTPAGTMGTMGIYSFFPAKNLGALGDGGAVVTHDQELADRLRLLRGHGAEQKYNHQMVGGNFRLDELQAALLSVKLPHLKRWENSRRAWAKRYANAFNGIPVRVPTVPYEVSHVYNQFVIQTLQRDAIARALQSASIASVVYYPTPMHLQPCLEYLGYSQGAFPQSEAAAKTSLALPIDPCMTDPEQDQIIQVVLNVFA